jgi:hypothetical protein
MHERKMAARREAFHQPHLSGGLDKVPSHVRNGSAGRNGDYLSADQSEARRYAHFVAFVKQQLKSETDTQQGFASPDLIADGPGKGRELSHGIAACADAGQNQPFGPLKIRRIAAYGDIRPDKSKGVNHTPDISGPVINNNKHKGLNRY